MTTQNDLKHTSYWAREPWFWFVMAPLIAVLISSTVMVTVAIYSSDDVVSDNYYKEGRMLAQPSTAEAYASSLGIEATLHFDGISGEGLVEFNQGVGAASIRLLISHPAKAERDVTLNLKKMQDSFYRADLPVVLQGRWYFRMTAYSDSEDDSDSELWRLHGEIDFNETHSTQLQ